jgi:hypothetical protein
MGLKNAFLGLTASESLLRDRFNKRERNAPAPDLLPKGLGFSWLEPPRIGTRLMRGFLGTKPTNGRFNNNLKKGKKSDFHH